MASCASSRFLLAARNPNVQAWIRRDLRPPAFEGLHLINQSKPHPYGRRIAVIKMIFNRVFFMFHHIRARKKREFIKSLAISLKITGVCKHGYPGFLYVEGEENSISTYVKEIKRLKWQSVEVRRKEREILSDKISIEGVKRLEGIEGVVEVETSKEMSEILRAGGLEGFLHKAMVGSGE